MGTENDPNKFFISGSHRKQEINHIFLMNQTMAIVTYPQRKSRGFKLKIIIINQYTRRPKLPLVVQLLNYTY